MSVTGTASQTSNWGTGQYPASHAIDGDPDTFNHTDTTTPDNYWELQLSAVEEIARVEIDMRADCCAGRMTGVILRAYSSEGDSVFSETLTDPGIGNTITVNFPVGVFAERIRLGFENGGTNPGGTTTMLHFGEVRVLAQEEPPPEILTFNSSPSGDGFLLSWSTSGATSVTLYPGGSAVSPTGSMLVSPSQSSIFTLVATNDRGTLSEGLGLIVDGQLLPIQLNEFMASNGGILTRSDGSTPDWIELWNPNPVPVSLAGYTLSDDLLEPGKFTFPSITLAPNSFLVVDASDNELDGVIALGFKLNRSAGSRLIFRDSGNRILTDLIYPKQASDVSYALDFEREWRYFKTATPMESNHGETIAGFVADTRFSVDRGLYDSTQSVEITTATPGATIWYSTDGSAPSPDVPGSTAYSAPIPISSTTILRAAAFRDDWEPTDVDTQSYIFTSQVANQSSAPDNFPQQWVPNLSGVQSSVPAYSHFGINDGIVGTLPLLDEDGQSFDFVEALETIPTMSLTIDADELFDPSDGLHVNARQRGRTWEREASIEVIDPMNGTQVQANCGLRMHGGWNRYPEMLKKSFRLYFRSKYGDSKLAYPLFEESSIEEFDRLILRSGNGKAWPSPWRALSGSGNSLERVTYLRDQFVRNLQAATGNNAIPGNFVHLYINGHYWGLYNPVERPTEHFAAARYGGEDDDYDVIKWQRGAGHQVAAGNDAAWNQLISLVRGNVTSNYPAISSLLDLQNFVDYLLVNFFSANGDWIDNNVYCMRNRVANGPFRFYCWDSEESWLNPGGDITNRNVSDTCMEIHQALRSHAEYRILFADRVQKHLFNGGALTEPITRTIFDQLVEDIDQAVVGESARWGELHRPANPYDRADWHREVNNIRNNYLGSRVTTTISQMQADGLFPSIAAPTFQPQHGGMMPAGSFVTLEAPAGQIYYTLDGSDPRLPGGALSPDAILYLPNTISTPLVAFKDEWKYLDDGSDQGASDVVEGSPEYNSANWKHPDHDDSSWSGGIAPLGYGSISGSSIATTVSYGDDTFFKHRTTYFRRKFQLSEANAISELTLRIMRDDGAVVYLNGHEIARSGFDPSLSTINHNTLALGAAGSEEGELWEFQVPSQLLLEGENVLAAEVHQASDSSSDLGFDLELVGQRTAVASRIDLSGDTVIRTRTIDGGVWSALDEAVFYVGDRAEDLRISELMYHPENGGAEFLELVNQGDVSHRIDDLHFGGGIQFDFSVLAQRSLLPGERLVLARDAVQFSAVYPDVELDGEYGGGLGNGGDTISLIDEEGIVLWTLTYEDDSPWPYQADGQGRSMIYLGNSPSDPSSWRPSVDLGGNPGIEDSVAFTPGGDLVAYSIGALEMVPAPSPVLKVISPAGADGTNVSPQWSTDLITWEESGFILLLQEVTEANLTRHWQLSNPPLGKQLFFRASVEEK